MRTITEPHHSFDPKGRETFTCTGACERTMPITKFPTTTTPGVRWSECRACRDHRYARTAFQQAVAAGVAAQLKANATCPNCKLTETPD